MLAVSLVVAAAALVGLALAVAAWRRAQAAAEQLDRRATGDRESLEARLAEREEGARAREAEAREQLERERGAHARALTEERHARERVEHARTLERSWVRELRSQVAELQARKGLLGDTDDVRTHALRIAVTLVGAEKGLLLSREDENSDGKLDFVVAEGFEHDATESGVAQRFAELVLARDETVRENDAPDIEREARTPADDEIENLVAIPIYIRDRFDGVVICANKPGGFDEHDDDVLLALGDHAGAVLQNGRLHGRLRTMYLGTVRMLAEAIEAKDPFLRGRSDRVSPYVAAVGDRLGLDPKRREELLFAWVLHDVGKIAISDTILHKPGPLNEEERSIVALHARIGYRLVEQVPDLSPLALHILHHHEHVDGSGYPGGLRGERIPLEARIIGVADAFGELIADRDGRPSLDEACAELEGRAGTEFDPEIVRLFVQEVRRSPAPKGDRHALAAALEDPELGLRRGGPEPVLGVGEFGTTDSLTLLYSRRHLHEEAQAQAERAALQGATFAVVVVELTEIDAINRAQGWAAGDDAIRTAARAVQRTAARHGGTAHRYGGARLAAIVPGVDEPGAGRVASELAAELYDEPSVRCGIAAWRPSDTGNEVIDRARADLTGERSGLERLFGGEG